MSTIIGLSNRFRGIQKDWDIVVHDADSGKFVGGTILPHHMSEAEAFKNAETWAAKTFPNQNLTFNVNSEAPNA